MSVIDNKIFTITAITFFSTLVASPSFAGVLCNIGERRVLSDVIIADAFSEQCFASCATSKDQQTYNAPPGWAIVKHWTATRHDRGRTTRSLAFATPQSNFASSSDFSSARSQEASGSAGQYNAGYSAGAKQIESLHNAYRASNTTITLTVTAQGRSPYAGSSKREEALNVEEICIGTVDDYRAAIRDELSLASSNQRRVGYFDDGGTVFYSNGSSYCGFVSSKHFDFYKQVNQSTTLGRQNPIDFGNNTGVCSLPSGYFDNGATVFFSAGNGTFCDFPNPQALDSHHRSRPQQPSFGRIDIDPNKFMGYTGVCQ